MILLIESGSTKTNWRLIKDATSKPLDFFSDGINPHYETIESIKISQSSIINQLKMEVEINQVFYFGTGISSPDSSEKIKHWLLGSLPINHISVKDDLLGSAIASMGEESGIIGILGTGSNSGYFSGEKIEYQIPTLGFWLGDEGSGAYLGKKLLVEYFKDKLPNELKIKFENKYGIITRENILNHSYSLPYPNRWFASFSKFLFDNRKNPYIFHLIKGSFDDYLNEYILKYPESKNQKIHFIGSIAFYYSDILKICLRENNLSLGIISENAMPGLSLFYKKFL